MESDQIMTDTSPTSLQLAATLRDGIVTAAEHADLVRLLEVARTDTSQARRVADFLLAWWNAGQCGGFDLTHLWQLDDELVRAPQAVIGVIARTRRYPDSLGYGPAFEAVVAAWRPELDEPA